MVSEVWYYLNDFKLQNQYLYVLIYNEYIINLFLNIHGSDKHHIQDSVHILEGEDRNEIRKK